MTVDFNESDKAMLEAIGEHRVVRLLFEMRVLNGPVWGEDANGTPFLGWVEADGPDNVAAQIDRDGNWARQDRPPSTTDREADLVERFRKALMDLHADDWDMEMVSAAAHICARVACNA